MIERQRLHEAGQVYVTLHAARQYMRIAPRIWSDGEGVLTEEARRELTEVLLDARRVDGDTETPERWRYRSRTTGATISARVVREGRLMVVLSISGRAYVGRSGKPQRKE